MKCLFIVNPTSGTKTIQKKLDKIIGQIVIQDIAHTIDVFFTQQKNDAYQHCLSLNNNSYDFLICIGGDGTVNEVISGIVEKQLTIPLALLPGGTVNDFANHLQLPQSTQSFLNMLKKMKTIHVDIGKVNNQYFANVIAGGMFSDISFQVSKGEKERFGPLAYYVSGIRQLPTQLSTDLHLHIKTENDEFDEEAKLFMITNTSQVGGFKGITPLANIQDGALDLLIIRKCSPTDMISLLKDYALNTHDTNPYIRYIQAKHILISCDEDIIYDIDGEQGTTLPIDVSVVHHAVRIIVP